MQKKIRLIAAKTVEDTVFRLFYEAARYLPADVKACVRAARESEASPLAARALELILDNTAVAEEKQLPVCQDTGMAVVFVDIGENLHIDGDSLENCVNRGVRRAYLQGDLRCSIVGDPLFDRKNTGDNTPAVLHIRTTAGSALKITAAPKGFGSENMSFLKMMTPFSGADDIAAYVTECVWQAGSNPCPPIVVGVGIGSNFEGVALLAKRALLRPVGSKNEDARYAALEERILQGINALEIGAQGFGGNHTALSVQIETAPTHIAGLPVAVNICCHVLRHRTEIL